MSEDVMTRSRVFATAAHAAVGQRRKYTNEPYIVHPAEVVSILHSVNASEAQMAAGWLHDVVEDTQVTIEDIWREFGSVVASYVQWMTAVSRPQDGNRAQRKHRDLQHLSAAPPEVMTIKLGDLISNTASIVAHDAKFAPVYLQEKQDLLLVLKNGNAELWDRAQALLKSSWRQLKQQ